MASVRINGDENGRLTNLRACPHAASAVAAVTGDTAQLTQRSKQHFPGPYTVLRPGSESSAYTEDCDSDEDLFLCAGLPATGRRASSMSGDGGARAPPSTASKPWSWATPMQSEAPLDRVGAVACSSSLRGEGAGADHRVGVLPRNVEGDMRQQQRAAPPGKGEGAEEEHPRHGVSNKPTRRKYARRQLSAFLDDKTRELEALMAQTQALHAAKTRRGNTTRKAADETAAVARSCVDAHCLSPVSSSVLSIRSDGARCLSPSIAGGGADTGETWRRSTILAAALETSAECGSRCTGGQAAVGVGDGVEAVRVGHNGGLIVTKSVPPKKERPSATSATPSPKLRDSHASGCLDYHVHAPSTRTAPNGPRSESASQVSSATVSPRACSGEGTVTSRAKL